MEVEGAPYGDMFDTSPGGRECYQDDVAASEADLLEPQDGWRYKSKVRNLPKPVSGKSGTAQRVRRIVRRPKRSPPRTTGN
jgi:hypothetical protein